MTQPMQRICHDVGHKGISVSNPPPPSPFLVAVLLVKPPTRSKARPTAYFMSALKARRGGGAEHRSTGTEKKRPTTKSINGTAHTQSGSRSPTPRLPRRPFTFLLSFLTPRPFTAPSSHDPLCFKWVKRNIQRAIEQLV